MLAVNPTVVDLLVAYTATAAQGAGGQTQITNDIKRAVAQENLTLANSEVAETVRLVGVMQTSFTELAGTQADLNALPTIPDIAAMKAQVGADLVDLWVGPADPTIGIPGGAGIAGVPDSLTTTEPQNGYAVNYWANSVSTLFAHEVGHMLGGGHVQGEDPTPHPISYAYDYGLNINGVTYTTAIDDQDTGYPIPFYSNPNVFFRGQPVGVADTATNAADNAHVMNQLAPLIASYAPTVVADTNPPIAGLDQVQDVTGQNSFTFDVTYYDDSGVDVTTLGNNNITVTGPNGFSANATFNGTVIDYNLTPIGASTVNQSVVQAVYTVNTPAAPGDLAAYSFAINANQVKDIAGNSMPAGALLPAGGTDPSAAGTPSILPRFGGNGDGAAAELGDLSGGSLKLTDLATGYYAGRPNFPDQNYYHFSIVSAGNVQISLTGPASYFLEQDVNNNGQLSLIQPTPNNIYNLTAGQNYYLIIGPAQTGITYGPGGVFTLEVNALGTAGIPATGSLSGTVFQDNNTNGVQDTGEPGIANVTLNLTGTDVNGKTVAVSTKTDANGNYTFTNLVPSGTAGYTITIPQNDGYQLSATAIGSSGGTQGGTAPDVAITGINVVAAATGYIFAEQPIPSPASISGEVFNDANKDGTLNAGEAGLSGITITLTGTDQNGKAINLTTTTAADGTFSFTDLVPGQTINGSNYGGIYQLVAGPAVGFNSESDTAGTGTVTGAVTSQTGFPVDANTIGGILLASGDTVTNYQFARTLAPATQAPPTNNPIAVTIPQGGTAAGNVMNAATPGTVTTTTGTMAALEIEGPDATKKKKSTLSQKQAVMYAIVEGMPQHALHFSLNSNGTYSYTPMPGFVGQDTFKYNCIMTSSGLCANAPAPVIITVKRSPQPPVASTETQPTVLTSQAVPVTFNLLSFVTDPDRSLSTLHFVFNHPAEGSINITHRSMATFIPTASFYGNTSLEFKASDGLRTSALITLGVQVTPAVTALSAGDQTVSVKRNKKVVIRLSSLAVDTHDTAKVKATITTAPTAGTARIVQGSELIYTPTSTTATSDSLEYELTDQFGDTSTGVIDFNIT